MKIINLPGDLLRKGQDCSDGIFFHNYHSLRDELKGRSILQTNAISLVISGQKTMSFSDKTITIKEDEFHFLSAGNCIASVRLSGKDVFRSVLIFFDNKVLTDFYLKYAEKIQSTSSKVKFIPGAYVPFRKDKFVWNFIHSLLLMFERNIEISPEMRRLKFEELMLHLLENYPETVLSFQSTDRRNLSDFEIQKAVESNVTNPVTVEELAFLCNVSLSTFKRRFRKIYKSSPNRWLLKRRMAIAKDLLQFHHERPSEIYFKIGYESHSSFSQSFKQEFGVTPRYFQSKQLTEKR